MEVAGGIGEEIWVRRRIILNVIRCESCSDLRDEPVDLLGRRLDRSISVIVPTIDIRISLVIRHPGMAVLAGPINPGSPGVTSLGICGISFTHVASCAVSTLVREVSVGV